MCLDSVKANGALNTRLSVSTSVHLFEGKENHGRFSCALLLKAFKFVKQ